MPAIIFGGDDDDTLRGRVDAFLADKGINLQGGKVTALMHARVLGYVFNPLSMYWCHDARGVLRYVIAEVHNTYGGRHAYLLPPSEDRPAMVPKELYASPFNGVDGHYLVRAPTRTTSWTSRSRCTVTISPPSSPPCGAPGDAQASARSWGLQIVAPMAPLMNTLSIRVQGILLWLRRVPVVPHPSAEREKVRQP